MDGDENKPEIVIMETWWMWREDLRTFMPAPKRAPGGQPACRSHERSELR